VFIVPSVLFLFFLKGTILSFDSLNLNPEILRAIEESGYTTPTPIQEQAIPLIAEGHDLMGSAQTGTGKTAAFMLPALNLIATPHPVKSRGPRILVLTPTRELAAQVNDAARKYGKFLRARTVSIVGGMPYPLQNKLLSQPLDILVATPGRLMDHMDRGRIDLSRLQMLILDEADRMLDMGFLPDIERICEQLPKERQTLLFSATFDGPIARIAKQFLNDPKKIEVAGQQAKHENITQRLHHVDDMSHKNKLLEHLLIGEDVNQAIIFTSTKRHADLLAEDLYAAGHKTAALHGDMTQGARNRTLTKLRHGDVKVLVATDVAARGIDVPAITHVINYDLPKFAEDYVHRIGRTGRAGNKGTAISFASNMDRHTLRKIEQFTGNKLEAEVIEGFEPKRPIRMDGPSRGGRDGQRRSGGGGYKGRSNGGGDRNGGGYRGNSDRPRSNSGDRNFGDRGARSERPAGDRPRGDRPSGDRNFSDRPRGDRPTGDRNFGDRGGRNERPSGERPRGDRPSGDRNFSDRPRGDRPSGDRNFGDRGARSERPNGDRPRGDRPSGDRNNSGRGEQNRSFGDSVAFGKKPFVREGGRDRNAGGNSSAPRRESRNEGGRSEGRGRNADSRSFGNNNTGNSAPRRPRSFV
jgi:superfamily II DNA/RNA helicase